ncbi:MAG: YhcH/YjgK/YiaL family protein [Clostridia bacterium]|nr:YhcH/YjgK/YiaL family protein [Clostridia bacterium]
MIFDTISALSTYHTLFPAMAAVKDFLARNDEKTIPEGKYQLGGGVYASVQSYDPKPETKFEAHKKYIDLQYIVSGSEDILYAPIGCVTGAEPYSTEGDIGFFADTDRKTTLTLCAGDFAVFCPADAHAPGRKNALTDGPVRKIVFKIPAPGYETELHLKQLCEGIGLPEAACRSVLDIASMLLSSGKMEELEDRFFRGDNIGAQIEALAWDNGITKAPCYLAAWMMFAKKTYYNYLAKHIDPAVYWNSMSDFAIWESVCEQRTGAPGLLEYNWLAMTLREQLYRLGRLQFEPNTYRGNEYVCGGTVIHPGMPVLNIHIPEGSPLTKEARLDSYRQAQAFFGDHFAGGRVVFVCESWLLYPAHREFLQKGSNIIDFMDDFTIVSSEEKINDFGNMWRIYGVCPDYSDFDALPQKTGMQRTYAAHLKATRRTGAGYGVVTFDGKTSEKRVWSLTASR